MLGHHGEWSQHSLAALDVRNLILKGKFSAENVLNVSLCLRRNIQHISDFFFVVFAFLKFSCSLTQLQVTFCTQPQSRPFYLICFVVNTIRCVCIKK